MLQGLPVFGLRSTSKTSRPVEVCAAQAVGRNGETALTGLGEDCYKGVDVVTQHIRDQSCWRGEVPAWAQGIQSGS